MFLYTPHEKIYSTPFVTFSIENNILKILFLIV